MLYGIVVFDPESISALSYIAKLLNQGHTIKRIFFYRDGVHCSQTSYASQWIQLNRTHGIELVCCVGSMQRRNLQLDNEQHFTIGGLGLLAECFVECDKVIQFG